jgi:hypothetical protein
VSIHYPFLIFSLLLLWFPRGWLRHGWRVTPKPARRINQAKVERDPYERGVKLVTEATKSRNWVDLFRSAVGAYGVTAVAITPPAETVLAHTPTVSLQAAILCVAVFIQMVRLEGRFSLFAPIFFVQGIAFGVGGPLVGFLAMIGCWALSPVLPGPGAVLFVQGALALAIGLLLHPKEEPHLLLVTAGVTWIPVLLSVLFQKRLSASLDKRLKIIPRGAWADKDEDNAPEGEGSRREA